MVLLSARFVKSGLLVVIPWAISTAVVGSVDVKASVQYYNVNQRAAANALRELTYSNKLKQSVRKTVAQFPLMSALLKSDRSNESHATTTTMDSNLDAMHFASTISSDSFSFKINYMNAMDGSFWSANLLIRLCSP